MTARCALYNKLFSLILFTLTATMAYFARILIPNEFELRKFCLFLQEWRFSRSRSSEVIEFWCHSKALMRLPISP